MPAVGWKKFSDEELRLAKKWSDEGVEPAEIADRLGRDKSTVTRHCVKMAPRQKQGRKRSLSEPQVDLLERRLDQLVKKARGRFHITAAALQQSTRMKVGVRTILDALHARNIYFRKLREKPVLSAEDVQARYDFARKHKGKSPQWWNDNVHAFIDGKHFKVYLSGKERVFAAQHATYGAYRKPGKGLDGAYVKPRKSLKRNTGAPSCLIMGGIGGGKCLMWHSVKQSRWSGNAAESMYTGPLVRGLKKHWPRMRKWCVLEDNDPSGFKSSKGIAAKASVGIEVLAIPPRSPDLNPCDYALWSEINRRMRKQELRWPAGRREAHDAYVSRLRRTAASLPRTFLEQTIGDMARRCQRLFEVRGHHFEEGGKGQ